MGYLRLFLAYMVLISHLQIKIFGLNPGVPAVVCFYILAGHVIRRLLTRIFPNNVSGFYKDRILRIFPLYWFTASVTLLFLIITKFGEPKINLYNLALNYSIIPLNYYMYVGKYIAIITTDIGKWWLIPPAWSLGAEVQVYFLMPFLLSKKYLFWVSLLGSLGIYTLANLGVLHPDYFGYRLVPGIIFMFLLGAMLENITRGNASRGEKGVLVGIYLFLAFYFVVMILVKKAYCAFTRETLLGILTGVPVIWFILKTEKKKSWLNKLCGNLSYGIFLSHFLGIWLWKWLHLRGIFIASGIWQELLFVSVVSFLVAFVGVWGVEKKVERIRFKGKI